LKRPPLFISMNNPSDKTVSSDIQWKRMSFKGNKVWASYDAQGTLIEKNDKVLIRYNLKQEYEYWIKKESLKPEDQAVPAGPKKKKAPKKEPINPEKGLPKNCIRIYTDGASSGNPGPSGIGVLLLYRENRKEISEFIGTATNNIAELKAIQKALSALKRRDLPVRIFTDSSYAIGQITHTSQPRANRQLILAIRFMMTRFSDIDLIKVKGHSGIKENEVADFLATSAIKKAKSE